MLIAIDASGNRINVKKTLEGELYLCPECKSPVLVKRGLKRAWCFAHYPGKPCVDPWQYEPTTDWHLQWEERYPEDEREVVISGKHGEKHKTDVLHNNVCIELRRDTIAEKEVQEKTEYYKKAGYKVVWIFNTLDAWSQSKDTLCPFDDVELEIKNVHSELLPYEWGSFLLC